MLYIEIVGSEVLTFYDPPNKGRNVGGYLGATHPGGSFQGLSYETLIQLGTGAHDVQADERARTIEGSPPEGWTEDDELFSRFRFELFAEKVGVALRSNVFVAAVFAMTSHNADRVIARLHPALVEDFRQYAASIPAEKIERNEQDHRFFSSSGYTDRVPDENLVTIRARFGTV